MLEYQKKYFYVIELISVVAFVILALVLIGEVIVGMQNVYGEMGWPVLLMGGMAMGGGYIGADFVSGLVHFLCDTFGSENTPMIGKGFIKAFRVHHDDPQDITRHDFVKTNGKNCLISLPIFILSLLFLNFSKLAQLLLGIFVIVLTLAVFGTNQFHKWAHTVDLRGFPLLLQRWSLILTKENHNKHHTSPYDKHYCITTGWLNPLLTKLKFFETITLIFKKNEYSK